LFLNSLKRAQIIWALNRAVKPPHAFRTDSDRSTVTGRTISPDACRRVSPAPWAGTWWGGSACAGGSEPRPSRRTSGPLWSSAAGRRATHGDMNNNNNNTRTFHKKFRWCGFYREVFIYMYIIYMYIINMYIINMSVNEMCS